MAAKLKIEKRGDEILIVHCCFSISQNERQVHRTQFWKGTIQGPFHQSLVQIGPVASEELIKM
jgi:hypothetical protein